MSNSNSKYSKQKTSQFQPKIINLSNTPLTKEQTDILSLGHSYAIEREPKNYINEKKKHDNNAVCINILNILRIE